MLSWLRSLLFRSADDNKGPFAINDPRGWEIIGYGEQSDAGEQVSYDRMLGVPAVWQAVGMISGDCSKLPLEVYRRKGRDREVDARHPARWIIRPDCWANSQTSALQLWRRLLVHALIWERGYVLIERDGGRPVALYNLLPDRTSVETVDGRTVVVSEIGHELRGFEMADVLIVENISISETESFGPLRVARHNVGLQLAKRKFQSKFYSNGCHAGGILQVPPGASDKATKKVQESIDKFRSGADESFRALVLRDGFKFHQVTINPDDAQAAETEEAEVRNVARFYRLAPSRLGVKESISYNSEEAARRAYHDETLSYWLTQIKTECSLKLITAAQYEADTHFIDYNIHALNWADTATVISVGVQGVTNGIFNRDEVRRWFNLAPLPDNEGEKFLQPLNLGVVGESSSSPGPDPGPAADPQSSPTPEGEEDDMRDALLGLLIDTAERMVTAAWNEASRHLRRGEAPAIDEAKLRTICGQAQRVAELHGRRVDLVDLVAGELRSELARASSWDALLETVAAAGQRIKARLTEICDGTS